MASEVLYREVDLLGYLPQYLQSYKELKVISEVEGAELSGIFKELGVTRTNQYISTCDEVGVERFESLLGIGVNKNDTLETRKARVLVRWLEDIPYTTETLKIQLENLCGRDGFKVTLDNARYYLEVLVQPVAKDRFQEVRLLVGRVVPCNLAVVVAMDYNIHNLFKVFEGKELRKFTHKELRENDIKVDKYMFSYQERGGFRYQDLGELSFEEVRRKGVWFDE